MGKSEFDYRVLHRCQYGVANFYSGGGMGTADCGEPATHKVWWGSIDNAMLVCQDHFNVIKLVEAQANREEVINGK